MRRLTRLMTIACLGLILSLGIHNLPQVRADRGPEISVSALAQRGKQHYHAGQFASAAEMWQEAAQNYAANGEVLQQARILSLISLAQQKLGHLSEASAAIDASLSLLATLPKVNPQVQAQILNAQAELQLAKGNPDGAFSTWKNVEQLYTAAGDEVGAIGSIINQAQALQLLGLYRQAEKLLRAIAAQLKSQPDSTVKIAGLHNLGHVWQQVGDLQASSEVLQTSLAVAQRLQASPQYQSQISLSLANTEHSLAKRSASLKDSTAAQFYRQEAIAHYQQAAAQTTLPLTRVQAQLNLFSLWIESDRFELALALLPQIKGAIAHLPASRAAVYAKVNLAETMIGSVMQDVQETKEVENILASAVEQAQSLADLRAQSLALGVMGKFYEQTENWGQGKVFTHQAMLRAQQINAPDLAYQWQWQMGRILQANLNSSQSADPEAILYYRTAVTTLETIRRDLVALNPEIQFSFRENVEPLYRQLVDLLLGSDPSQEDLRQAREVIEKLQLAEIDNFFREACLNAQPQQIHEIDAGAAVVYPIILPERLAVILELPDRTLRYYQTAVPQQQVERMVRRMHNSLNPIASTWKRLQLSKQIYDWLVGPGETELASKDVKTLVFVLDGVMRNLPMAALYDGQQYLVEKYNIALTPGLNLLDPQSLRPEEFKLLMAGLSEARQGFSALPAVELEVQQISALSPGSVLLNQTFLEPTLQKLIDEVPFPIIHLATHGQFSSNPEETFILTWNDKIKVKELEKLLKLRETAEDVPIELLVLSACQTASGDNRAALGLAGLAVRSGARSTLATLWSVNDQSTADLMVKFYQALTGEGVSKAEALRQAQLELLQSRRYQHPFYWAPFVLVGNWL
ncbi:MAG: CHAT domain-containing protein [Hormoscilla sp.]